MKTEKFVSTGCMGKDWRDEYKRKTVSPEEAVKLVKSGDRVIFPVCSFPRVIAPALYARKDELRNVTIHADAAQASDVGMFYEDDQTDDIFSLTTWYIHDLIRHAPAGIGSKRTVFLPGIASIMMKPFDERRETCPFSIDVVVITVSPPDKSGFCSFGANLWHSRSYCRRARTVIAQVDPTTIRTGGTNYIHVSQIDCFVDATPDMLTPQEQEAFLSQSDPEVRELMEPHIHKIVAFRRKWIVSMLPAFTPDIARMALRQMGFAHPPKEAEPVAGYISELIHDGDTFNIGHGAITSWLAEFGAFDNKHDLGFYSEGIWSGFSKLVEKGIITGKHKTFHPGKVTTVCLSHGNQEDMDYMDNNPVFECYDFEYLIDIRNVSKNDNYMAINQAASVDLTGQINSESAEGGRMISGPGGQPELHMGGVLSKGGRAVIVITSTALNGSVSRIVPQLDQGATVTIPRYFADYIVTEYGIASLMGKNFRQRAEELIAVAHPDFRPELKAAAKKFFYP